MKKGTLILICKGENDLEDCALLGALSTQLPAAMLGDDVIEFQYLPPGMAQTVNAHGIDGKPKKATVDVDEGSAKALQAQLSMMLHAAEEGTEDAPYFDFNHDDREASAWPMEFRWAGDDVRTGGVRVRARLSSSGIAAIRGRTFRRFSPAILVRDQKVVGMMINGGGFVNRAAFKNISPLWAKGREESAGASGDASGAALQNHTQKTEGTDNNMKQLLALLAKLGLVGSAEIDEAAACDQIKANHKKLTEDMTAAIQAKESAEGTVKTLTTENTDLRKRNAEAVVAKAVAEGRLPAQDKEGQDKWVALIAKDATQADLLNTIAQKQAPAAVLGADSGKGNQAAAGAPGEHAFVLKCREVAKAQNKEWTEVIGAVSRDEVKLYTDYMATMRGGS